MPQPQPRVSGGAGGASVLIRQSCKEQVPGAQGTEPGLGPAGRYQGPLG